MSDIKPKTMDDVWGSLQRVHNRLDERDDLGDLVRESISASEAVKRQNEVILQQMKTMSGKVERALALVEGHDRALVENAKQLESLEKRLGEIERWRKSVDLERKVKKA